MDMWTYIAVAPVRPSVRPSVRRSVRSPRKRIVSMIWRSGKIYKVLTSLPVKSNDTRTGMVHDSSVVWGLVKDARGSEDDRPRAHTDARAVVSDADRRRCGDRRRRRRRG